MRQRNFVAQNRRAGMLLERKRDQVCTGFHLTQGGGGSNSSHWDRLGWMPAGQMHRKVM